MRPDTAWEPDVFVKAQVVSLSLRFCFRGSAYRNMIPELLQLLLETTGSPQQASDELFFEACRSFGFPGLACSSRLSGKGEMAESWEKWFSFCERFSPSPEVPSYKDLLEDPERF